MNQLPTVEKQVGEYTFEITQLTATEARKIQLLLMKVLGPALAHLDNQDKLDKGAIGSAIQSAVGALDDASVNQLVAVYSRASKICHDDGRKQFVKDCYDVFFAGKMLLHMKWLGACLEVTFSDFFGEAASLSQGLGAVADSLTK